MARRSEEDAAIRIAQVAPLMERVPPRRYGGTERVVSYLTEALVRRGHDVTLFASADSITAARLVPGAPRSLRTDPSVHDPLPLQIRQLAQVWRRRDLFDVVHFHVDLLHLPLLHALAGRAVTTLHGRLDLPGLDAVYGAWDRVALVSISDSQRAPMPPVHWCGTVHHGLPEDLLPFVPEADTPPYLALVGRVSPEKGIDTAIEIARRAGLPLRIAAKVDTADRPYWDEVIAPLIAASPHVRFEGEIDEATKADLIGRARALLFPIRWPEPFGLVMIEAMSCGTPVVAFRHGAVAEVVSEGASGFVVDDVAGAVAAVQRVDRLDRRRVRACFERRFTASRMARAYEAIYQDLLPAGLLPAPAPAAKAAGAGVGRLGVGERAARKGASVP